MQTEFLIVGQGISGTWLSWFLEQEKREFHVIDHPQAEAPSRLAAGLINPVTGRRHVETWMADTLFPFVWQYYHELGQSLGVEAISEKQIIDFFPSPQMRLSFLERVNESASYVQLPADENSYRDYFHYGFGYGMIRPAYTAHLENILPARRKQLLEKGWITEELFDPAALEMKPGTIQYKNISATAIIFCDGSLGAANPYFKNLPFAPNKGEALILEIPGLPNESIYKKGLSLIPLATRDQWWMGSSYEWDFHHPDPSPAFLEKTVDTLRQWLKLPFLVNSHLAGIRPATLERRPFVGMHPLYPSVGILNGMGTKGCSLSPFFARQLVDHLLRQQPITAEASVNRFAKLLQRP